MRFDCDSDALLLLVDQTGPACHTNRPACFYHAVQDGEIRVIAEPVSVAQQRRPGPRASAA